MDAAEALSRVFGIKLSPKQATSREAAFWGENRNGEQGMQRLCACQSPWCVLSLSLSLSLSLFPSLWEGSVSEPVARRVYNPIPVPASCQI